MIEYALQKLLEFNPDFLLVSAGFDAYVDDPITEMTLELEDFAHMGNWLSQLKSLSAVLEGGYSDELPQLIDIFLSKWDDRNEIYQIRQRCPASMITESGSARASRAVLSASPRHFRVRRKSSRWRGRHRPHARRVRSPSRIAVRVRDCRPAIPGGRSLVRRPTWAALQFACREVRLRRIRHVGGHRPPLQKRDETSSSLPANSNRAAASGGTSSVRLPTR